MIRDPAPPSPSEWRSFTLDTVAGAGQAGILHQRIEAFDARLLAIVERFESARP